VDAGKMMNAQRDLLQVILTFGPQAKLTHFLDGRNQESQQYGNYPDNNQQFDESDTWASSHVRLLFTVVWAPWHRCHGRRQSNVWTDVEDGPIWLHPLMDQMLPRCHCRIK
jgi:hypothetical protein